MYIRDVDDAKRTWDDLVRRLKDEAKSLEDWQERDIRKLVEDLERDVEDMWDRIKEIIEEGEK